MICSHCQTEIDERFFVALGVCSWCGQPPFPDGGVREPRRPLPGTDGGSLVADSDGRVLMML